MEKKNEVVKTNSKAVKIIDIVLGVISSIALLILLIVSIILLIDIFFDKIPKYVPGSGYNEVSVPLIILLLFNAFYSFLTGGLVLIYAIISIVFTILKKRWGFKISTIANGSLVLLNIIIWIVVMIIKIKYC